MKRVSKRSKRLPKPDVRGRVPVRVVFDMSIEELIFSIERSIVDREEARRLSRALGEPDLRLELN